MSKKEINEALVGQYFTILQKAITRMAQNSFLIKGWTITILAAIIIFTYNIITYVIFIVLLGVLIIFWVLDSYYLRLERLFRRLYDKKVEEYNNELEKPKMTLFEMNFKNFIDEEQSIPRIMLSKSEILFYLPLILMLIVFLILNIFLLLT